MQNVFLQKVSQDTKYLISESVIQTKEQLLEITKKTKIQTFLIGESLLKNLDKNSIF